VPLDGGLDDAFDTQTVLDGGGRGLTGLACGVSGE
jgi:hypothetical protein